MKTIHNRLCCSKFFMDIMSCLSFLKEKTIPLHSNSKLVHIQTPYTYPPFIALSGGPCLFCSNRAA